jgi:hypothetical protein
MAVISDAEEVWETQEAKNSNTHTAAPSKSALARNHFDTSFGTTSSLA